MRGKSVWLIFLGIAFLVLIYGLALPAQAVSFASAVNIDVGTAPISVTTGDFNRDGKLDLAVANRDDNNISILLGNGSGGFSAASGSPVTVGTSPVSVAVGDFNRDGKPDLAVANNGGNNVSILLGNGDGTFITPAPTYGAGTNPMSVAVGDFDGNGKLDLAVANVNSANVSILLGDGSGGFSDAPGSPVSVGSSPISVVAGDFDGDGELDLAVANYISLGTVSILLGNGDGTFVTPAPTYAVGTNPISVAVGDFDGDGDLDLATANFGSGNVSVLLGSDDGTFVTPAPTYAVEGGGSPHFVTAGDFDGDGKLDLAVADNNNSKLSILAGNGNGTFAAVVSFGTAAGPFAVASGDFNGDGKPDLVAADFFANKVSILLNTTAFDPAGVFAAAVNYGAGTGPQSVAVGDFDGDGKPDLAVANWTSANVSILLGVGDGTFQTAVNYGVGTNPYSVVVGDFNRDGKPDLAIANYGSDNVSILLGVGDGTFAAAVNYGAGTGPISVAVGDFNRDGKPDLVAANYISSGTVSILLGNGDGTFTAAVPATVAVGAYPISIAVGDFNGDGELDLAVANDSSNNVSILLGNGDGTFAAAVNYGAGTGPISVAVGDFNRDGKLDLATANWGTNDVSILLGVGDGTFGAAVNYGTGNGAYSIVVGDFNGDGKMDLAVANETSNNVSILLGVGDGTFAAAVNYGAGSYPESLAVGDFNRDGKPDLATANYRSANVSILLNTNFVFPNLALSNLQINGGLTLTASPTVTLTYATSGSPTHIRTSTGIADPVTGAFWSTWKILPVSPHNINLGATNGTREVYAQLKEGDYMSPVARATIMLDTAAPAGKVKINNGAVTVRNTGGLTTVYLHLAMFDRTMSGAQMRIKVGGGGFAGDPDAAAPWVAFTTSTTKDLTGTGLKTIYVQFKDGVGKKSAVYAPQITVSNSGAIWPGVPTVTVGSMRLNDYSTYTTNPTVTLKYNIFNYSIVQARYCFTNSAGTTAWTAWETPALIGSEITRTLTLYGGNGARQVYVQMKEGATGKITDPTYDEIVLDTTAPGGNLWINNGEASVTRTGATTYVALTLVSNDTASSIDKMAIYQGTAPASPNDGDLIGFSPTVVYPLDTTTIGTKKVFVWFKDKAGKVSVRKSDGINVLGP